MAEAHHEVRREVGQPQQRGQLRPQACDLHGLVDVSMLEPQRRGGQREALKRPPHGHPMGGLLPLGDPHGHTRRGFDVAGVL
ncbi:hypothetical protein DKP78_20755, partial [Enterococcus faecium]